MRIFRSGLLFTLSNDRILRCYGIGVYWYNGQRSFVCLRKIVDISISSLEPGERDIGVYDTRNMANSLVV